MHVDYPILQRSVLVVLLLVTGFSLPVLAADHSELRVTISLDIPLTS